MLLEYKDVKPYENVDWRRFILKKAEVSSRVRAELWEACRQDVTFYINTFVWTYDPESAPAVLPFVTWPAQEKAIETIRGCMVDRRDLAIEKSRRQGGSWLSLMVMEHEWHFKQWRQFLMISRDANMVDGPTPDSLFWKIDFIHRYLPPWLMPKGWDARKHRLRNYYENPQTGSTITGQATSAKAGVGGRAYAMFVDEFARIDEDQAVLDSTADTSRCRIFNSTHTGTGTAFYRLLQREDVRKLRLHWKDNPYCNAGLYRWDKEKNRPEVFDKAFAFSEDFKFVTDGKLRSPWYDNECLRRANTRAIAMDLDIDAAGSSAQFFDQVMIQKLIRDFCQTPSWEGDLLVTGNSGDSFKLEERVKGPLKLWIRPLGDGGFPAGRYTFGWDLATGTSSTPSCCTGLNCQTGEKFLEYANAQIDPREAASIAVALCRMFKDDGNNVARLIWEQQGPGVAFGDRVLESGFRNIYFQSTELPQRIRRVVSDRPGWTPNKDSTRIALESYRAALSMRQFINRSERALKETEQFLYTPRGDVEHSQIESTDDPSGARINHGDRVIADALAWKIAKGEWKDQRDKKTETPQAWPVLNLAYRRKLWEDREKAAEID